MTTEGKDAVEVEVLAPRAARGAKRPAKRRGVLVRPEPEPVHALLELGKRATPWEARQACGVEELVNWTYGDQLGDARGYDGGQVWPGMGGLDSCEKVARIAAVGCAIDVSRVPLRDIGRTVHPVAEAVAAEVAGLDAHLVAEFGRLGVRPGGWSIPSRFFEPEGRNPDGSAMTLSGREGRGGLPLPYCPIVVVATLGTVARARMRYLDWWAAMDLLWWRLSHRNLGFGLEPLRAPRAPWEEPDAKPETETQRQL